MRSDWIRSHPGETGNRMFQPSAFKLKMVEGNPTLAENTSLSYSLKTMMSHRGNRSHVTRGRGKPDRVRIRLQRKDLLDGGQTHIFVQLSLRGLYNHFLSICLCTHQGPTLTGKQAHVLAYILHVWLLRGTLN